MGPKEKVEKSEGETVGKTKKEKKEKVKRAPTAFILFCKAKRPEIKAAQPDLTFGSYGKIFGEMWSKLDDEEKAPYIEESATQKKQLGVEKKPKVSRPPSPYMIFCSQARIQVKKTHPTATFGETGKILGAMWSSLDENSKAVYSRAAADQKAAWPVAEEATEEAGEEAAEEAGEESE